MISIVITTYDKLISLSFPSDLTLVGSCTLTMALLFFQKRRHRHRPQIKLLTPMNPTLKFQRALYINSIAINSILRDPFFFHIHTHMTCNCYVPPQQYLLQMDHNWLTRIHKQSLQSKPLFIPAILSFL
jgi:hypothetical protein